MTEIIMDINEIIKEKVSLLRDFCILKGHKDPRTEAVKKALKQCGTELRMENMLHDVLIGKTTLDEMLKKRGFDIQMKKSVFTIGEYPKAYIGYTSGKLWNGWATPHFELEEAKRIAEGFNECAEYPMQYDEIYDQFYILDMETEELEKWKGIDVPTAEGIKHLYGIGAYSWVWDKVTDAELQCLAEGIEDFIYEYDTYEYRDVGIEREERVEAIKNQLKELTVFKQVYEVWHNEDLNQDERFDELSKLLTL